MFEREFPEFRRIALEIKNKFGIQHRLINCIEECSELQKCLTKILRWDINPQGYNIEQLKQNCIFEIADVYITIEESKYILGISDNDVIEAMNIKINNRLKGVK